MARAVDHTPDGGGAQMIQVTSSQVNHTGHAIALSLHGTMREGITCRR